MSVSLSKPAAITAADAPGYTILLPDGTELAVMWPEVFPHDPRYVTLHGTTQDGAWDAFTLRAGQFFPLLPDADAGMPISWL